MPPRRNSRGLKRAASNPDDAGVVQRLLVDQIETLKFQLQAKEMNYQDTPAVATAA